MIDYLLSAQTLVGVLIAIGFWLFTKTVDKILEKYLDGKFFAPIWRGIRWRWKAFKTRFEPLSATFQMSYSPRNELTIADVKRNLPNALKQCEKESGDRIQTASIRWDDSHSGEARISHIDENEPFLVKIHLQSSNEDIANRPDIASKNRIISKISFEIDFKFAYRDLGDTLANLDTLISILEDALDAELGGSISPGQFVIRPVDGELTLDEWVDEEGFEVSMLLAGKGDQRTQVEFFPDRAEVRPPYLHLDSEVRRYLNILILEYYLKKQNVR